MSDPWLAITYVAIFAAVGGVIAAWLLSRARKEQLQWAAERNDEYRSALAQQSATNEQVAAELAQTKERLGAIEGLLRDVAE